MDKVAHDELNNGRAKVLPATGLPPKLSDFDGFAEELKMQIPSNQGRGN